MRRRVADYMFGTMKNHFERFGAASQAISPLGSTVSSAPCGASARRRSASVVRVVLRGCADEQVLPAAREREPLRLELLRKRDRLGVAGQVDPHLPLGVAGGGRVGRVLRLRLLALLLLLLLGVGEGDVAGLPLLGERVPAVERERRRHVLLREDRAHEVARLLGRLARVGVEEEPRPVGGDGDRVAELLARLLLDLVLVELRPEPLPGAVLELDRDSPVLGHRST